MCRESSLFKPLKPSPNQSGPVWTKLETDTVHKLLEEQDWTRRSVLCLSPGFFLSSVLSTSPAPSEHVTPAPHFQQTSSSRIVSDTTQSYTNKKNPSLNITFFVKNNHGKSIIKPGCHQQTEQLNVTKE